MKTLLLFLIIIPFYATGQTITTIAGNRYLGFFGDGGPATLAELYNPNATAIDRFGNLYITDQTNARIRKIDNFGIISTFAGGGPDNVNNGIPATSARLSYPTGLFFDTSGNLLVSQSIGAGNRVRLIDTFGNIFTIAGNAAGSTGGGGMGGPATAAGLYACWGVVADKRGNVYIGEAGRICKVNAAGIISVFAGNSGAPGFSGDGGPATAAVLKEANGIAIDNIGNIFVSDYGNLRIRKIDTFGIITTFAGNGTIGFSGDGGQATAAELNGPEGITADNSGNIYFADNVNNKIRKIDAAGIISSIAGHGPAPGFSGDGGPATAAVLDNPSGVSIDIAGNIYITDQGNNIVRKIARSTLDITSSTVGIFLHEIYPNPAIDKINITFSQEITNVSIYTVLGRCVYSQDFDQNKNKVQLNISNLSNGIYYIKTNGWAFSKIVKE